MQKGLIMGLDQYLWRKKYGDIYDFKKEYPNCKAKKLTVKVTAEFADGDIKEKEYIVEDLVAYMKKKGALA